MEAFAIGTVGLIPVMLLAALLISTGGVRDLHETH